MKGKQPATAAKKTQEAQKSPISTPTTKMFFTSESMASLILILIVRMRIQSFGETPLAEGWSRSRPPSASSLWIRMRSKSLCPLQKITRSALKAFMIVIIIIIANTCAGVAGLVPFSSPCLRTRLTRLTVSCVLKYFCLGHCGFLKKQFTRIFYIAKSNLLQLIAYKF